MQKEQSGLLHKDKELMSVTKYISVKEFRARGYLQEVNRNYLHPLGLALGVEIAEDGSETFFKVMDCREDPEGVYFESFTKEDRDRARIIAKERQSKGLARFRLFGSDVQEIVVK